MCFPKTRAPIQPIPRFRLFFPFQLIHIGAKPLKSPARACHPEIRKTNVRLKLVARVCLFELLNPGAIHLTLALHSRTTAPQAQPQLASTQPKSSGPSAPTNPIANAGPPYRPKANLKIPLPIIHNRLCSWCIRRTPSSFFRLSSIRSGQRHRKQKAHEQSYFRFSLCPIHNRLLPKITGPVTHQEHVKSLQSQALSAFICVHRRPFSLPDVTVASRQDLRFAIRPQASPACCIRRTSSSISRPSPIRVHPVRQDKPG